MLLGPESLITCTGTVPSVAVSGTYATMRALCQLLVNAAMPSIKTVPLPPKLGSMHGLLFSIHILLLKCGNKG